jgi:hypothetical protein
VLTARNLEYLQELKGYGKRVIIVVNQVDVLEPEDREKVRDFVLEQSRQQLGTDPRVWLVSAKQAMAAQQETPRDEIAWDESGFAEIEEYILDRLDDVERVRQKLETPAQISQNVIRAALDLVQDQQAALDEHRKTTENIEAQIEQSRREQQKTVEDALDTLRGHWNEAIDQGQAAIGDLFQFSRGLSLFFSGLGELLGIARLLRRFGGQTRAENAFEEYKVRETLDRIPQAVDRLGPRLEGRDLQDIDDLVDYTRGAVKELPESLSGKVIGKIQTPLSYDRSFLRNVRGDLDDLVRQAQRFETSRLDRTLRNTLIVLALWEILTIALVAVVAVSVFSGATPDAGTIILVFGVGVLFVVLGMALVPLQGMVLRRAYANRLGEYRDECLDKLRRASEELIAHGVQLRRDATAPFTRLIESQSELLDGLRGELQAQQQAFVGIQGDLAALSRPKSGHETEGLENA